MHLISRLKYEMQQTHTDTIRHHLQPCRPCLARWHSTGCFHAETTSGGVRHCDCTYRSFGHFNLQFVCVQFSNLVSMCFLFFCTLVLVFLTFFLLSPSRILFFLLLSYCILFLLFLLCSILTKAATAHHLQYQLPTYEVVALRCGGHPPVPSRPGNISMWIK